MTIYAGCMAAQRRIWPGATYIVMTIRLVAGRRVRRMVWRGLSRRKGMRVRRHRRRAKIPRPKRNGDAKRRKGRKRRLGNPSRPLRRRKARVHHRPARGERNFFPCVQVDLVNTIVITARILPFCMEQLSNARVCSSVIRLPVTYNCTGRLSTVELSGTGLSQSRTACYIIISMRNVIV